jgi:hypothetical protein
MWRKPEDVTSDHRTAASRFNVFSAEGISVLALALKVGKELKSSKRGI